MQKTIKPTTKNIITQKLSMPLCRQYFDKYIFIYITLKQINNGLYNNFPSNAQIAINCNCSVRYIADNSVTTDSIYFAFLSGLHYVTGEKLPPVIPFSDNAYRKIQYCVKASPLVYPGTCQELPETFTGLGLSQQTAFCPQ